MKLSIINFIKASKPFLVNLILNEWSMIPTLCHDLSLLDKKGFSNCLRIILLG